MSEVEAGIIPHAWYTVWMAQLLVDANIYIELYKTKNFEGIVSLLNDVKETLFVSEQIVMEVERNRADALARCLDEMIQGIASPKLPSWDIFEGADAPPLTEAREAASKMSAARAHLAALCEEAVEKAVAGTDALSKGLAPLFAGAEPATQEHITRARRRKELGQPPGKRQDPLGDEITWEAFLSGLAPGKPAWIVTQDSDYFVSSSTSSALHLKPTLAREVLEAGGTQARVFRKVGECVRDLLAWAPELVEAPPPSTEIERAEKSEAAHATSQQEESLRRIAEFQSLVNQITPLLPDPKTQAVINSLDADRRRIEEMLIQSGILDILARVPKLGG